MKRLRNIRRVDDDSRGRSTHAWLVQVQRDYRITMKMFSDGVCGGKRKALQAAIAFRTQLLAEVSDYEHQIWLRSVLRRNNTSGIAGVSRHDRIDNPNTGRRVIFWLASWADEHGASRKRKFSVLRYGERKAKKLAVAERELQLKRVCAIKSKAS